MNDESLATSYVIHDVVLMSPGVQRSPQAAGGPGGPVRQNLCLLSDQRRSCCFWMLGAAL